MLPAELTPSALEAADTPTLRAELARALTITAQSLAYLAAIWAELTRRGEDLSELRVGLAQYLPAIAAGTLAAEAVVAFAGNRSLIHRILALPVDEQRRIASGEPLPVVVQRDNALVELQLPARTLTAGQARIVFDDDGRVRSPIEQRQILSHTTPRARQPRTITRPEVMAALAVLPPDELRRLAAEQGFALVPICSQPGCTNAARARSLCPNHYARARKAE